VLRALQEGKPLPYTAKQLTDFAKGERGPVFLEVSPAAPDAVIKREVAKLESSDTDAGKRAAVWKVLADCAERGIEQSERLRIVGDVPAARTGEKRDVLRVCWLADTPRDVPTLLLDSDADETITERLYPGAEIVRAEARPNADVIQVSDRVFSKSALRSERNRQELAELVRAEVWLDKCNGARGVLAIATKQVVRWFFEDAGHNFEGLSSREISDFMQATELHGARWLWFGPAALGRNDWRDFGSAVVIGREELPLDVLQDYARAIGGDTGEALELVTEGNGANLPEALLPYTMADGSGRAARARAHPGELGRALQMQGRELATRQAIERLRLATAEQRKRVVLACKIPIPGLPVTRLVTWQELRPSRLMAAMAEAAQRGGVLRLSPAGLAEDAPQTFTTAKAAQGWLEREGRAQLNTPMPVIIYSITGAGVLNPVRAHIRLQGQRGRATPALIVLPGNPRELAEAQLGELADFEAEEAESGKVSPIKGSSEPEPEGFAEPIKRPPKLEAEGFFDAIKRAEPPSFPDDGKPSASSRIFWPAEVSSAEPCPHYLLPPCFPHKEKAAAPSERSLSQWN
jgi:hypothetical protein